MCWENWKYFSVINAARIITIDIKSSHIVQCVHRFLFTFLNNYCVYSTAKSQAQLSQRPWVSGRNLSSEKRAQAVTLANAGYSQIHIERVLGCCRCAKSKTVKRYRETGYFKDKPGRGRSRVKCLRGSHHGTWASLPSTYNCTKSTSIYA